MQLATTRSKATAGLTLIVFLAVCLLLFQAASSGERSNWLASSHAQHVSLDTAKTSTTLSQSAAYNSTRPSPSLEAWPYAYATFLSEGANYTSDVFIRTSTVFFNATRVLAYQLLHAPLTRTHHAIPFIVLVTPTVPQIRRDRLTADGCTVIEVSPISIPWMDSEASGRWRDVATKLHLVNMTAYERIAFIDADMLLRLPLDDLFREPAIRDPTPTRVNPAEVKDDEAVLPESYVFAAAAELEHFEHAIPPGPADAPNLNAGFWVVRPDVALFEYYLSVLNAPWRFFPAFPEQAMLNYAHRVTGNMPWARLRWDWNVNFATAKDLQEGARSLHGKWWMEDGDGTWNQYDREIERMWRFVRDEMLAFWAEREGGVWSEPAEAPLETPDEEDWREQMGTAEAQAEQTLEAELDREVERGGLGPRG